jgi:hypothetical protein
MDVTELCREELDELKTSLFYQFLELDDAQPFAVVDPVLQRFKKELLSTDFPEEIPDQVIFEIYSGINFVKEDFFCNL